MKLDRRQLLSIATGMVASRARAGAASMWTPRLGVLGNYSEKNLAFVREEGFTSIGLWANPKTRLDADQVTDSELDKITQAIRQSGVSLSVVGSIVNHVDPDPTVRARNIAYFQKVIALTGRLGAPYIGTASGQLPGRPLREQVDQIVRVYNESYFPLCQKHKVRLLWEPWPGGPNIATGPVGYDALFRAFGPSDYVGLQYDPSHLVWQMMDPLAAARDFVDKIYDVHLKDTEVRWPILRRTGIHPVDNERWWRYRLPGFGSIDWPGFFTILMDAGYKGAMNIEHEDDLYGWPSRGDDFSEPYKEGFRVAHRFLRQYLPASASRS